MLTNRSRPANRGVGVGEDAEDAATDHGERIDEETEIRHRTAPHAPDPDNEDEYLDKVSSRAIAIRNAFFDKQVSMDTVIPPNILIRKDYKKTTLNPRKLKHLSKSIREDSRENYI